MKDCLPIRFAFIFSVVLFTAYHAVAQHKKTTMLDYEMTAFPGKIVLVDATELTGDIIFHDDDGLLSFREKDVSRSFTAPDVLRFEYFDPELKRSRRYYSLDYHDEKTGLSSVEFFEVLKELPSFAVLAKLDRIQTKSRNGLLGPYTSPILKDKKGKKVTQTETIFFMNQDGDLQPYLKIVENEIEGGLLDINHTQNKFIDSDLFEQYTGIHYKTLVRFADDSLLSFKSKKDIIVILDQYQILAAD
jgi:hypothetical protein